MFRLVHELSRDGFPVTVACRVLKVSTSGFYEWRSRGPSARDVDDACLIYAIRDVHQRARGTYGVRRVHAELRLGRQVRIGHGRVERLMRIAGLQVFTIADGAMVALGACPQCSRTTSNVSSPLMHPTGCGSWTSRSTAPGKAGFTWLR